MSEVVRSWSGTAGRKRRFNRQRARALRNILLLLIVAAFLWASWTTRDTWDMERLIPGGQSYEVYANDILDNRGSIAQSRVWNLLPEDSALASVRAQLSDNFGMPEWVLNNVVNGLCHLSGNDLEEFHDALFVTKMTHVGCLIEKLHRFIPEITRDHAGGLELRQVPELGLWYAVRGRVLLVSRDRFSVVRALTLSAEEALGEDAVMAGREGLLAGEDLFGRFDLRPEDPAGPLFQTVEVRLWVEPNALRVLCQSALREEWRERLMPVLESASPNALLAPPAGVIELSANFGKPLPVLWEGLRNSGQPGALPAASDFVRGIQPEDGPDVAALLSEFSAYTGDGWRISLRDIDDLAFVPMPQFAATLDADVAALEELLARYGAAAAAAGLHYAPEQKLLSSPLIGGQELEPVVAIHGSHLLFSSSRTVAETIVQQQPARATLSENGNLFLRVRPEGLARELVEAGHEFAAFGALRGHTQDTWETAGQVWIARAAQVRELTALLVHETGILRLECNLLMHDPPPPAETPAATPAPE